MLKAVTGDDFPDGNPFVWIAGEASTVRALRRHLMNDRNIDKSRSAFTGYWRVNMPQDAEPTREDIQDASEQEATR